MRSVADLAAALEAEHPFRATAELSLGACRVRVRSNSPELVARLERYFSEFRPKSGDGTVAMTVVALEMPEPDLTLDFVPWEREPGKTGRKEAFCDRDDGRIVRKVRTGMHFLVSADHKVAFGPCLANTNQVINFINFQYTTRLMNLGCVLCHAAGVVRSGRGLGLAAFSGGGKSTLALHLLSRGLGFVSNDRLLVRQASSGGTEAFGIPKLPRINPGTALGNPDLRAILSASRRRELADLDEDELWELEEKYDVPIGSLFGPGRIELEVPLDAFAILSWQRRERRAPRFERVDLASRRDLLAAVMKPPGPFFLPESGPRPRGLTDPDVDAYLTAFRGVAVYEVSGGLDFEAASDFLLENVLPAGA